MLLECYVDGGGDNIKKTGFYGSFKIKGEDGSELNLTRFDLDCQTSNEAEYESMKKLLEYLAKNHKKDCILIYSDSKLVVNQLTAGWAINKSTLRSLNKDCKKLISKLEKVGINWVSRKVNLVELGH